MPSGKQRVMQAAKNCNEDGYRREDGKWVDPLPVQKVAIEEGFRQAVIEASADVQDFSIWSVIGSAKGVLRKGNTVAENFERAVEKYDNAVDRPEVRSRLKEMQSDMEGNES